MKKIYAILLILSSTVFFSCNKESESIVDCVGESFLLDVHHTFSIATPRQASFTLSYSGDHSLDNSIRWDFGDGTPAQTVTGTSTTHTYAASGTYTAKARVSLNNGRCSYDLTETVTVP